MPCAKEIGAVGTDANGTALCVALAFALETRAHGVPREATSEDEDEGDESEDATGFGSPVTASPVRWRGRRDVPAEFTQLPPLFPFASPGAGEVEVAMQTLPLRRARAAASLHSSRSEFTAFEFEFELELGFLLLLLLLLLLPLPLEWTLTSPRPSPSPWLWPRPWRGATGGKAFAGIAGAEAAGKCLRIGRPPELRWCSR